MIDKPSEPRTAYCAACGHVWHDEGVCDECPAIAPCARRLRRQALRTALEQHYITAIDCDHDAKTDTVRCNCSVWTGSPQPSVGAAVQEWVEHVRSALGTTEAEK